MLGVTFTTVVPSNEIILDTDFVERLSWSRMLLWHCFSQWYPRLFSGFSQTGSFNQYPSLSILKYIYYWLISFLFYYTLNLIHFHTIGLMDSLSLYFVYYFAVFILYNILNNNPIEFLVAAVTWYKDNQIVSCCVTPL